MMTANNKSVTRVLIVVSVEQDKERYQTITDLFKGTVLEIANRMDFANGSMKEGVVSQSLMDFGEIAATGEYDLITGSQVGFKTKPEDWAGILLAMQQSNFNIDERMLHAMVALSNGNALITPTTVVSSSEITGSYKGPTEEAIEIISSEIISGEEQ